MTDPRLAAGISRLWLVVLAFAVTGLDQLTKFAVVAALHEGESRPLIDDVLRLSHIRNSGSAFGLIRGVGGLLALAALVGVITFFAIVVRRPPPLTGIAAALVAGGALGNLLDRLIRGPLGRGTVVDFVDFRYWPAFNVADSAITIGALFLVWAGLTEHRASDAPA